MDFGKFGPAIFDHDWFYVRLRGVRKRVVDFVPTEDDCARLEHLDLARCAPRHIDAVKRIILPSISDGFAPVSIANREGSLLLFG